MSESKKSPDLILAKKLNYAAYAVSAVVILLVSVMHKITIDHGLDLTFLPAVYSFFNFLTAVVLVYALVQIKKRNIEKHRKAIYVAMTFSALFLLGYVVYHVSYPDTPFCGERWVRNYIYLPILISHIILAAIILPFILFTFIRAYTGQYDRHRTLARWVFPLWLYVAATGPILYLFIRPCYPWIAN